MWPRFISPTVKPSDPDGGLREAVETDVGGRRLEVGPRSGSPTPRDLLAKDQDPGDDWNLDGAMVKCSEVQSSDVSLSGWDISKISAGPRFGSLAVEFGPRVSSPTLKPWELDCEKHDGGLREAVGTDVGDQRLEMGPRSGSLTPRDFLSKDHDPWDDWNFDAAMMKCREVQRGAVGLTAQGSALEGGWVFRAMEALVRDGEANADNIIKYDAAIEVPPLLQDNDWVHRAIVTMVRDSAAGKPFTHSESLGAQSLDLGGLDSFPW